LETDKKHIVIIEDDSTLLTLLGKFLQAAGYRTTKLGMLSSMEDLLASNADCFLVDEQLPNVTGHIICMLLKKKPETKEVPVILMSAFDELEYFADLACANTYLKKPFTKQQLLDTVSSVLSVA